MDLYALYKMFLRLKHSERSEHNDVITIKGRSFKVRLPERDASCLSVTRKRSEDLQRIHSMGYLATIRKKGLNKPWEI